MNLEPFAGLITKVARSPQLFKDPEWWSARDLNSRPPARQSGALPTELAGWQSLQSAVAATFKKLSSLYKQRNLKIEMKWKT